MIDISKITREEISNLPNKKELLKERREWLKKQRKGDKLKVYRDYSRKIRKLGYIDTRDLQSFTVLISKNNYLIFTVRELRSGKLVINNKFHESAYKKLDKAKKHTKHFSKCGNGRSLWWCRTKCGKRKEKECNLVNYKRCQ